MAKTMILNSILISYVALISLVSLSESDPLTEASITGFTTDLIRRALLNLLPMIDPSLSHSQRIVNALKPPFNRVQRLQGRQLRHVAQGKFSYFLVSLTDQSNSSKVHFGANAKVSGSGRVDALGPERSGDLLLFDTGRNQCWEKEAGFLKPFIIKTSSRRNIIIDSGTTLTLLPADLYAKLENAMKSSIKLKQIKDPQEVLSLCFLTRKDDIKIPEITVHFRGGDVKWKNENVFVRTGEDALCLAAAPENFAIYGNLVQINFSVGYDLEKRTVSFKPPDCGR